jgi:hypothetical protein
VALALLRFAADGLAHGESARLHSSLSNCSGPLPDRLAAALDRTVVAAPSQASRRAAFLRYLLDRPAFQK